MGFCFPTFHRGLTPALSAFDNFCKLQILATLKIKEGASDCCHSPEVKIVEDVPTEEKKPGIVLLLVKISELHFNFFYPKLQRCPSDRAW